MSREASEEKKGEARELRGMVAPTVMPKGLPRGDKRRGSEASEAMVAWKKR